MSSRILILPALQKLKELLCPPLLKETHQRALNSFHFSTRDLGDPAISVHVATSDLLELEVTSNISVNEDLGKLSRCDDELGDKINSIVTVATEFSRGRVVRSELAIQLDRTEHEKGVYRGALDVTDLCKVQTGTVASIVVIPVHV